MEELKIAIDGPSASGKGTISKILAEKLNAIYLNTGKIYRIVAFVASKLEGDIAKNAIIIAKDIEKYFKQESENKAIYNQENAMLTSKISAIKEVREALLDFQKNFAKNTKKVILEGRDIGTVIMPEANFKFYLDATAEERAKRRMLQFEGSKTQEIFEQILKEINERDENDKNRNFSALTIAKDAIYIDTTNKTIEEVINLILSTVNN